MEANKNDGTAVEMETAVNSTKDLDMTMDIAMGKAIADFLGESKVDPKNLTKSSSEPEIAQIMHIRNYKEDEAVCKELNDKLMCMIEENSSNIQEQVKLLRDVMVCIEIEKRRTSFRKVVTLNRRRGQLKKIWASRGLPVDEKSLQSAASKDVFDMSSLIESLPSKPDDSGTKKKAEKLAKEYLSFTKQKMRSFRKSEILRILASNAPVPNNNSPSSSSKHHPPRSLTRMVKKVCGDVKNVHIFSFRPMIKRGQNSSVVSKRVSCPELRELHASHNQKSERTQDLDGESRLQNEEMSYRLGQEMIVLLKSSCTNTGKARSDKQKDDSNTANNLRNPEHLLFNRDQFDDEQHRCASLRTQQLHSSISLGRQLSRLKIANSRRDGLSEGIDESEIQAASTDQDKDQQEKVVIAVRRREVLKRLRGRYKQHEKGALKKN
ncbi:hypothetical protein AVEN_168327-1 [Araneus ventricosus]|uniref:Uncharacterized protein n=1 Tax=Araneus ventricosus TaxID=182803 RepID=A0A4Y2PKQ2_ARAVE|nr:hypothetical protein AVEN_168327-1 [Araneus ventricosus]